MRGRPNPAALRAAATAATGIGLALILGVTAGTVNRVRDEAAGDVGRMAAALWELPGGGEAAVTAFLAERATIEAVRTDGARTGAGAHAYRTGELEPAAWIAVAPGGQGRTWPHLPATLALSGLLLMTAWAVARRRSPPSPRFPTIPALIASLLLAATAVAATGRTHRLLADLTTERATHGARAAEVALAHGADHGQARRAAGLPPAITPAPAATPAPSGTPTPSATPTPSTLTTPSQPVTPSDLLDALPGYEDTRSPAIPLTAAAAASSLATALLLFLLPLSTRPRTLRRTLTAWSFLTPAAVLLLLFTFGPLLFSLWISLHEWHLVDRVHPFTGLDNYLTLTLDGQWWSAILNTAVFTLHVPFAMAVALGLALLTRGSRRAVRWARLALFLPGITSVVAIAVVWKWLLDDGYGLVNRALEGVGIRSVPWLTSPDTALVTLMAISVWMVVGYQMVVFQAGLAAIPRDWYDAARVDGAGPLQRFRHITLPGLRHTLFFVLVTSVIGSFQVFGLVYVMTEGGPLGATDVAVYHIYREAWEFLRFGNAAAMSWVLFAVVFAATWLHFRFLERRWAHA
ncbi:MAG: sugar ABC transporter permease [Gemmatimonadota bacterium]|nr:sugar ABC transporter permease [Gemmatimonadota bacterium]